MKGNSLPPNSFYLWLALIVKEFFLTERESLNWSPCNPLLLVLSSGVKNKSNHSHGSLQGFYHDTYSQILRLFLFRLNIPDYFELIHICHGLKSSNSLVVLQILSRLFVSFSNCFFLGVVEWDCVLVFLFRKMDSWGLSPHSLRPRFPYL